jgi:RND family efflux transporter MFP subunit
MKLKHIPVKSFIKHLNPFVLFRRWWSIKGIKKWLLLVVVIVVFSIVGNQVNAAINRGKPNLGKYQMAVVVKQDMTKTITKEGMLRYNGVVDYPAPSSGIITDIWVKNGDEVKKGQNILKLQSTASVQEQTEAWNQYAAAKSAFETAQTTKMTTQVTLEAARQTLLEAAQERQNMDDRFGVGKRENASADRPSKIFTDNEIEAIKSEETQSRSKFAIAEREFKTADVHVQAAQAALNTSLWKYQLTKDAVITAPVDGQITNLNVQKGETISSKDGFLFRIVNSGELLISLKASESEVLQFQVGQDTQFTTSVYPEATFSARIITVDTIGTEIKNDNGSTIEYLVKIKPESTDKKFPSPLTVDTETVVERKPMVLSVPNAAVTYSAGKRTVNAVVHGKMETREVVLGIVSDQNTEIISGLSEGDTILVPKVKKL